MTILVLVAHLLAPEGTSRPTTHDRVVELTEGDAVVRHDVEFDGTLHIWTRSEADLTLRVTSAESEELGQDEDSGGVTTPYLRLEVSNGDAILVHIAGKETPLAGELHLIAAPETDSTRALDTRIRKELAQGRDNAEMREACTEWLAEISELEGGQQSELVAELAFRFGRDAYSAGATLVAERAWDHTRRHRKRTLPEDHPELLMAHMYVANAMHARGELESARALLEVVVAGYERVLPEDHPTLFGARMNLADTMRVQGDLREARALGEVVLAGFERTRPENHPDILGARMNLAITMHLQGDFSGARENYETVLEALERFLPAEHPSVLQTRLNLATTMQAQGELVATRKLLEDILDAYERTLPEDHPQLLGARSNVAAVTLALGDISGARALFEAVLAGYERTLPEDHPELIASRANLGSVLISQGDLSAGRALYEAALDSYERTHPADHPDLLAARLNLASAMKFQGDTPGARALYEAVLEAYEEVLPEHHPDISKARMNLAGTLRAQGDLEGARELHETVVDAYERTRPEDDPDLLTSRLNLALIMAAQGDRSECRPLLEAVIAGFERIFPADHPRVLKARAGMAALISEDDPAGARALEEAVLEGFERTRPEGHPELFRARLSLAKTLLGQRDFDRAHELTLELAAGVHRFLVSGFVLSPREGREVAASVAEDLSQLWRLSRNLPEAADPRLERAVFESVETARHLSSVRLVSSETEIHQQLQELRYEAAALRARINDIVAGRPDEAPDRETTTEHPHGDLTALVNERDRVESRIRRVLVENTGVVTSIELDRLTQALDGSSAVVTFRRYDDAWSTCVVRRDGSITQLASVSDLDRKIEEWRTIVCGATQRGVGVTGGGKEERLRALGEELRAMILDPVFDALKATGESEIYLCLDDVLHLLPLDALPLGDGIVGEAYRLRFESSLGRLIARDDAPLRGESLVAVGGVNYHVEGKEQGLPEASDRGGPGGMLFTSLRETRYEAENIAETFEALHGTEPVLLTRSEATKSALKEAAVGARWLHVATHGYFAPEAVKSSLDTPPDALDLTPTSVFERRVEGMAPMALCGLALAGANLGRDTLGRVPGILTAEELAGWDLTGCELVVLSACETNVGVRRAGQSIQSLQAAIHSAGARASVTSLWKVDDERTRELMENFYTRLWVSKEPKAQALWNAKMVLRKKEAPTRDWAGWILVGDPD